MMALWAGFLPFLLGGQGEGDLRKIINVGVFGGFLFLWDLMGYIEVMGI
jgi:hypothetical protein